MFHPVGSQPPSVYWRRRLLMLASTALVVVLIVLTVQTAFSTDSSPVAAGNTPASTSQPAARTVPRAPGTSRSSSRSSKATSKATSKITSKASSKASASAPASPAKSSSPPALRCQTKDLSIAAVTGQATYTVGDKPMLELEVTNTSSKPCVQDLADKQVELRVYNGESRVWGSHDCEIQPGTNDRTLAVAQAVRVSVVWSGLTSRPGCAGRRQRVGAGTYTLYAVLSGKNGRAAQFSIKT